MSYETVLAAAIAIVLLAYVAFGASGYVIRKLLDGREWGPRNFVKFLARYSLIFGLFLGLEVFLLWSVPTLHNAMRDTVASAVGGLLRLVGAEATVAGPRISVGASSPLFDVSAACLGGVLFWVYLALVSAETRATRGQRLKGIFIGLAILVAFNILRITVSVYLEGVAGLRVHDYFYLLNMLVVLLVWAGWVRTLRATSETLGSTASP
jgi:exosortase/archaeosortase family protein